jgi:hypothetical protein
LPPTRMLAVVRDPTSDHIERLTRTPDISKD